MTARRKIKKGRRLPDVLTHDEQARLLKQPNRRYRTGLRNWAMISLMLNTGLRCAEIINLQHGDIEGDWLKVRQGKGAKDRVIPLSDLAVETLDAYKAKWPQNGSLFVFPTLQGGKLSSRYVRQMVSRYGQKAGIQKRVHVHLLRHTFATDYYKATRDLLQVQKLLGHADISTTTIYTHLVDEDLQKTMKGFRK